MKFRTFIIPLAVVAGLVFVLGVGLLGGIALRTPLYLLERGGQSLPEALQFVPKQSALVASVLVRPDRLAQVWDYLAAPKQRQSLQADRERLEQAMLAQTGLTYGQDIQPWLGEELTAALVTPDLDQDPSNGSTPGYLVVLSCKDATQARSTLELFWQNRALAGEPLTFEDVGGAHLIYGQSSVPTQGFIPRATVMMANRFILVANDPWVLRQAMAAAQAVGENVRSDRRYRLALQTLSTPRVGLVAINLPQVKQWLYPDQTVQAHGPWSVDRPPLEWGLVSLGLQRRGILAEAAWVVAPGHRLSPHHQTLTMGDPLTRPLPPSLGLAAVGVSLEDLADHLRPWLDPWWQDAIAQTTLLGAVDHWLGQGATGQILAGMDQPYALGLDLGSGATSPGWLLVSSANAPTQDLIRTLGRQAQDQGLGLGRLDILGYPTTVWTRLSLGPGVGAKQPLQVRTEVAGLSAEIGRQQVLTTSPDLMAQTLAIDERQGNPAAWRDFDDHFPQAGESYVHLDWPQLEAYLSTQLPPFRLWETAARPALKHLQTITLTSYGQTDQVHHAGLFLELSNPS